MCRHGFVDKFAVRLENHRLEIVNLARNGKKIQAFSDEELREGRHIVFSNRGNTAKERLKKKQEMPACFKYRRRAADFEEGELFLPPIFESTAEERKSGFQY